MPSKHEKLVWQVRKWWNERIVDGCQLEFVDDTHVRSDWMGEGRWKTRVAVSALHRDFCRSKGIHVTQTAFSMAFTEAARAPDRTQKTVQYKTWNGVTGRKPVAFVRFGKAPLTPLPT
jgi:hypothetical protein